MPEERTLDYVNRPEGEMDMMIGFFLMNGICVAFFLLFGLCVIFSCLRQRPRIFRRAAKPQSRQRVPSPPQPRFKASTINEISQPLLHDREEADVSGRNADYPLVSRAIRTGALEQLKQASEDVEAAGQSDKKQVRVAQDGDQIQVHVLPSQNSDGPLRLPPSQIEEEPDEMCSKTSVVRQNLLGPLTFDDLYYT